MKLPILWRTRLPMKAETNMKGGRPPKDQLDELHVLVWYYLVKSKCNLGDHRLSRRFCDLEEKEIEQGARVPQLFERIRQKAQFPSKGNHPKRKFNLVERVDADPLFAKTANVFYSPFWQLLENHPFNLASTIHIIDKCLDACEAARLNPLEQAGVNFLGQCQHESLTKEGEIDESLKRRMLFTSYQKVAQSRPYSLDAIALAGGLFREAYLLCRLELAIMYKDEYTRLIQEFVSQDWVQPIAELFLEIANERLYLKFQSKTSNINHEEYRSFDESSSWIFAKKDPILTAITDYAPKFFKAAKKSIV